MLFSICWVWVSKYEFLVSRRFMGNRKEKNPQGIGTVKAKTGTRNWRQGKGKLQTYFRYMSLSKFLMRVIYQDTFCSIFYRRIKKLTRITIRQRVGNQKCHYSYFLNRPPHRWVLKLLFTGACMCATLYCMPTKSWCFKNHKEGLIASNLIWSSDWMLQGSVADW